VASALESALAACEDLLQRENRDGADEALIAGKEAAVARLEEALKAPGAIESSDLSLVERLRSVLDANRFSLRWSALRAELGRIGQVTAKAPAQPARPRIDLVN
jgi:hypothetical protein